jgi:hypothetical protein
VSDHTYDHTYGEWADRLRREAAALSGMRLAMAEWLEAFGRRGLPPPHVVTCDFSATAEWLHGRHGFGVTYEPGRGWQYVEGDPGARARGWIDATPEACADALAAFLRTPPVPHPGPEGAAASPDAPERS